MKVRVCFSSKGLQDGWTDECMNGREECEYLFLTAWRWSTWQQKQVGVGGRQGGEEVELWMDEVSERRKEGVSGGGWCPADSQAAGWWSHLSTESAAEMTGQLYDVT